MVYGKSRKIGGWIDSLLSEYAEFKKKEAHYRCKICGIEKDKKTGKDKVLVKMNSVKNQIPISYYPDELACNDSMLREFSQTDVRAITFYALKNSQTKPDVSEHNQYKITGQEFYNEKTIFTYNQNNDEGTCRISAYDLYADTVLLRQFGFDDILNIIHAAVQEQTIEDMS